MKNTAKDIKSAALQNIERKMDSGMMAGEIAGQLAVTIFDEVERRSCTCHPDDCPPSPCPHKFALKECRAAAALEAFPADDFSHTAHLFRGSDEKVLRATLSNNLNIIIAALDIAGHAGRA